MFRTEKRIFASLPYLLFLFPGAFFCIFGNLTLYLSHAALSGEQVLSEADPAVYYFVQGVFAPILEEILFRYLLYGRLLRKKLGWVYASLICAAVFALLHFSLPAMIYAFVLGLVLCEVYERTKRAEAPVFLHIGANSTALLVTADGVLNAYLCAHAFLFAAAGFILLCLSLFLLVLWENRRMARGGR